MGGQTFDIGTFADIKTLRDFLAATKKDFTAAWGPITGVKEEKDRQITVRDGEKIAMTAPVTQHSTTPNEWTIGFTMPADYAMDTLPAPADRDVTLKQQPAQTMAVLKFTGLATARDMDEARRALMQKVAAANLVTKGEPVFAFYDPPWTLAFMRRNEVMIEVVSPG